MNPRIAILASILLLTGAGHALAQCEERLMIPVIAYGLPGNYGSIWRTRVAITNHSPQPLQVTGIGICFLNPCPMPDPIEGGSTIFPASYQHFLGVECGRAQDMTIQLRVQDVSRQSETWGTSIPVVGADDLYVGRVMHIVDVPNGDDFRSMLRVYGFDGAEASVTIRIYELDETSDERGYPDRLIATIPGTLPRSAAPHLWPSRLELPLWMIPEIRNVAHTRVEIEGSPTDRLWSFVSATNNATQHVTVLTPE
ncbi:MAG: hypothetical protein ACYC7A_00035 [Thermoanaerobaculia bacterium]